MNVAADFALMREWVLRRVDTITYPTPERGRRDVSVDLDLGARVGGVDYGELVRLAAETGSPNDTGSPSYCSDEHKLLVVPLAVTRKQVLAGLDVRDESGNRVPVATSGQNKAWSRAVLEGAALIEGAAPSDLEWLRPAAKGVVEFADDFDADPLTESIRRRSGSYAADLAAVLAPFDAASPQLQWLARVFAENFPVLAVLPAAGAPRRVVKYGAEFEQQPPRRRLPADMAGSPYQVEYELADAYTQSSYHVELHVPAGAEIVAASVRARQPTGSPRSSVPVLGARRVTDSHMIHFVAPVGEHPDSFLRVSFVPEGDLVWGVAAVGAVIAAISLLTEAADFAGGEALSAEVVWAPAALVTGALGLLAYRDRHRIARSATRRYRFVSIAAAVALVGYLLSATTGGASWAAAADRFRSVSFAVACLSLWFSLAWVLRSWLRRCRRRLSLLTRPSGDEI